MILATTIKLLLYRYSNQTDMLIGTPVAGRLTTALESIVGFLANTLVLRTSLAGQPSFRVLLQRVREVALAAYAHQALPFERLLQQLGPNRSQSHLPVFQVLVTIQNSPEATLQLVDTKIVPIEFERGTAKFDLSFVFTETMNGLAGGIEYNTDLFDAATIERMIGHLNSLLLAGLSAPDLSIARLPLLTTAEYARYIAQSRGIASNFPSESCVLTLFEQQVARTPHALAVVQGHASLTYQALDHQANQLAYYLAALGVKPGTGVGLCIERTLMMVVGMMGILRLGAIYVPIDPSYPPERQAYMVANAGLVALVTQDQLASALQAQQPKLAIVALDTDWTAIACAPRVKLPLITADMVLYSIYTSGSTGVPKGTEVTHRNFVNLLNWYITEFNLGSDDRFLLVTSLSFDLTQKNVFAPLISGGTLYLYDAPQYDPHTITSLIDQHAITVINCTPSAFYPLVETTPDQAIVQLKSLRWLFLGGEPINLSRFHGWMQSSHYQATIINTYGPTECTDIAASY
ncbi:MAG TPA: hypothetical protein DEF47_15845 [Herpetosiphon sp.]|uniref:AMP-dependent synthetase and ligase n=2 Tax=Herpetosiphon TaxID=64 RepID=A9B4Q0_HERA2|nr:AMP-dependent synthetase and ligase [Herpetosiphon aurantiacus DSM 785]HBW51366.1 hypothetical protein [Herpetosiphon sp.]